jgi:Uma2 family endonuclease
MIDGRVHIGNGQYVGMGNNVDEHQRVQTSVWNSINTWAGSLRLEVNTEAVIHQIDGKYRMPDVVVFDKQRQPKIIVEVCYTKHLRSKQDDGLRKLKTVSNLVPSIVEAFAVDFQTKRIYRLSAKDGFVQEEETNFSEFLNFPLQCDPALFIDDNIMLYQEWVIALIRKKRSNPL